MDATNAAIASAPERISLEAFFEANPRLPAAKVRLTTDGQFVYLRPVTQNWGLYAGNGARIVCGTELSDANTFDRAKPAGIRAVAELAERLSAIRDREGRPAPWTSRERDWPQGWLGPDDLTIAGMVAAVVDAWATSQGLDYSRSRIIGHKQVRLVVGGVKDAEGFHLSRDGEEAAPGDRVRWNDLVQTVVSSRYVKDYDGGNPRYRLHVTVEHGDERTVITEPRRGLDIAFTGGDPDAPEARHSPGMGMYLEQPGIPVDEQRGHYIELRRENLVPPGTRVLVRKSGDDERYRDIRPTVAITTAHVMYYQGHHFQVLAYDDGTFDGVKPSAFTKPDSKSKTEYVLNPDPDELRAARRAWGLDGDGP